MHHRQWLHLQYAFMCCCLLFINGDNNFRYIIFVNCIGVNCQDRDPGRVLGGHIHTDQAQSSRHADHGPDQEDPNQEGIASIYVY